MQNTAPYGLLSRKLTLSQPDTVHYETAALLLHYEVFAYFICTPEQRRFMSTSGKSGALEPLEGWWFSLLEVCCFAVAFFWGYFCCYCWGFFLLEGYFAQLNDSV